MGKYSDEGGLKVRGFDTALLVCDKGFVEMVKNEYDFLLSGRQDTRR